MCFSISICEKKVASIKFVYSTQGLEKQKKKKITAFLCTFSEFDTSKLER